MAAEEGKTPQALLDRPSLHSTEVEAWNAFSRLSLRRPVSGFGSVGAIPYVEMLSFVDDILGVDDPDDRDTLIELIEHIDGLYLKEVHDKMEAERKKTPAKPPKSAPRPPLSR